MGRHYERGLWDRHGVSDNKGPGHVRLIRVSIYFVMNVLPYINKLTS